MCCLSLVAERARVVVEAQDLSPSGFLEPLTILKRVVHVQRQYGNTDKYSYHMDSITLDGRSSDVEQHRPLAWGFGIHKRCERPNVARFV